MQQNENISHQSSMPTTGKPTAEIERKWLMPFRYAEDARSHFGSPCGLWDIRQIYIGAPGTDVRLRRALSASEVQYTATIKTGSGLSRTETTEEINELAFWAVWRGNTRLPQIWKSRVVYELEGDLKLELDDIIVLGGNVFIAEIEFKSREQAESYEMPVFGAAEVTEDPRFSNKAIAKHQTREEQEEIVKLYRSVLRS